MPTPDTRRKASSSDSPAEKAKREDLQSRRKLVRQMLSAGVRACGQQHVRRHRGPGSGDHGEPHDYAESHHARSVPVPVFLVRELRDIARLRKPDEFLFGEGSAPMRLPNSKNGWFAAAVKRAMDEDRSFPYVSPHGLRHTAASLAISAGANVKAVQRMLGHSSAAMTLDTYSDLFDDDLDAVSEALDRARSQSMDTAPWMPPGASGSPGLQM